MAYQIIKSGSAGRWIKQPNRLVKTFPSGLCMIQQDYIADRNFISYEDFREGDILSQEDSSPCIDQAYIFPAPGYQDMGNGFVKCTVVAYGRVNTTGTIESRFEKSNFAQSIIKQTVYVTVSVNANASAGGTVRTISSFDEAVAISSEGFIEVATEKFVIAEGESLISGFKDSKSPLKAYNELGIEIKYPLTQDLGTGEAYSYFYDPSINVLSSTVEVRLTRTYQVSGTLTINPILINYQTTGFGFFKEVLVTYAPIFKLNKRP